MWKGGLGAGASKVRRGTFQNWKWIGKWILEVIDEGQTHLYYAEITTGSGENRKETRKDGVTPVRRFFQPGTPHMLHHICVRSCPSKSRLPLFPSICLESLSQIPLQLGVTTWPRFRQWNMSRNEMCNLKGVTQDHTDLFHVLSSSFWLDGSEKSGNLKIIEQLFAWVTVEHMVGGN